MESVDRQPMFPRAFRRRSLIARLAAMLAIGTRAPDFTLLEDDGRPFVLSEAVRHGPLVLYFYPRDFSFFCTTQARMFSAEHRRLAECGIRVFGVGRQDCASHGRFRHSLRLPFGLLADTDGEVTARYGAVGLFGWFVKRVTYVIGQNGLIQQRMYADLWIERHRKFVQRLAP